MDEKTLDFLKKAGEQFLHFAWSFFALAPVAIWGPNPLTGGIAGILLCLPRELVDQWPINRPLDTVKDIAFFCLGGVGIGLVGPLIAAHWRL